MSENNGWPGKPGVPLNPEKDGWHWLVRKNEQFPEVWEWNAGPLGAVAEYGDQSIGAWLEGEGNGQPKEMAKWYRYLGPALTPAEMDARIATARKDALEEAARAMIEKYQSMVIRPNTPEACRLAILQDLREMSGEKPKIITAADIDALAKDQTHD